MAGAKLDVQKRQHRERGQLQRRQRLGLLEKHQDYVKRAKAYHSKQDRLKRLQEKAAARNKDEFYFGMLGSRTEGGVHVQSRGNKALDTDLVKLLKTQDAGYIRMQRAVEEKRVGRLQEALGSQIRTNSEEDKDEVDLEVIRLLQQSSQAAQRSPGASMTDDVKKSHVRFVDSAEAVKSFLPKGQRAASNKGKEKAIEAEDGVSSDDSRLPMMELLASRLERLKILQRAERELDVTRALMGNGSKKVVGSTAKRRQITGTGRDLSYYSKLDRIEQMQEEDEAAREATRRQGVKTGARVYKWRAERRG